MKKIIFSIFISLLSPIAFTQGGVTGGGFGVVKRNAEGKILDAKSFDLWMSRTLHPELQIDLGGHNLSAEEKVTYVLDRFAKLDPDRAEIIREFSMKFLSLQPGYVTKVEKIEGITDDAFIFFTFAYPFAMSWIDGYLTEQACLQVYPSDFSDVGNPYTLSTSLWEKMDADSRAALALHEAIYRMAILYYHHNSTFYVVPFNAFVMSKNLKESPTEADFVEYQNNYVVKLRMFGR